MFRGSLMMNGLQQSVRPVVWPGMTTGTRDTAAEGQSSAFVKHQDVSRCRNAEPAGFFSIVIHDVQMLDGTGGANVGTVEPVL